MCGICGELRFGGGGAVESAQLVAMRRTLAHRGPDAAGIFVSADGSAGLAVQRLSVIDPGPDANQPLSNEDGSLRLVCNGEIYNAPDLRRDLAARGHRFRSGSDSEVILHLYEERGADCVDDLDGMFGLALWDGRASRLLLARDRAGKKPLFFHRSADRLVFASEIKAFFAHPRVPVEVDPSAIPLYLLYGYVPGPATFYRGIHQLDPGTRLTAGRDGSVATRRFWRLRLAPRGQAAVPPGDPPAAAVRRLLTRAVERRLVSDVPVGAFLSGGIDSTIVVGLMTRLTGRPVRTFSIGFLGDPRYDETAYARTASTHFGTDHTEQTVTPADIDLVDTLLWHHDGPFGDSSAIPTYIVSRLARRRVTVVLTGEGGDELFAGYMRFPGAVGTERIPKVLRRIAGGLRHLPAPRSDRHWLAVAQRAGRRLRLPFEERFTSWIAILFDGLEGLLDPGLLAAVGPIDRLAYLRPEAEAMAPLSPLGRLLHATFHSYLRDDILVKTDRCTMACSLEARCPYLDRGLIEYVAVLPDDLKLRGRRTKVVLKEAFADLLPRAIARRGKMGFAVPLGAWFRGPLRDFVADVLLAPDVRYTAYLSRRAVHELVQRHQDRESQLGEQLWALICLELWLRRLPGWLAATPSAPSAFAKVEV